MAALELTRDQILAFRRRSGGLGERLPAGSTSLRHAAWAGLQDSAPRAALLSINARVEGTKPTTWEDPSLVQVWGPRFSVYVVHESDRALFSLGRLSADPARRRRAEDIAARLSDLLGGDRMTYRQAGKALGVNPNSLRYAAPTGTVLMRWEGAGQPVIWVVPRPDVEPAEARLELARRFLHIFGPSRPESFADWAGVPRRLGIATFDALDGELTPVRTPIGDSWILTADEAAARSAPGSETTVRLLPSGDAYYLLQGDDRELLVGDGDQRSSLWPSRVWPGAVLLAGEIIGTWRRANERVAIQAWKRLSGADRQVIEDEAGALPIPGLAGEITVQWLD